jgi:hypothetical protein
VLTARAGTPWFGTEPLPLTSRAAVPEVLALMREAMDDIAFPMRPASLRPVVLPPASYAELFTAGSALLALLRRALLECAPTAAGRVEALGADPDLYPLFVPGPLEEHYATCIARPDVVVGADGPKFVEFNVGAGIGGVVDTSLNAAAWTTAFGGEGVAPFTAPDPLAVRDRIFVDAVRRLGVRPAVAVVGSRLDLNGSRTTRYFEVQADSLRGRGLAAELFEPEDLLSGLGMPGPPRYRLGLRHFTVQEWREHGIDLAPVRAALDAGCLLVSTQTAYLVENKKVLAWISAGRPWMTGADRALVRRYVPWTRVVGDERTTWRGREVVVADLLLRRREDFVLKPAVGMKGQDVLIGRECAPAEWSRAVHTAVDARDRVVQEHVAAASMPMEFADDDGTAFEADVRPVLSPFLFDGRPAGCMVRYLPPGRDGVVSVHGRGALPGVAFARR